MHKTLGSWICQNMLINRIDFGIAGYENGVDGCPVVNFAELPFNVRNNRSEVTRNPISENKQINFQHLEIVFDLYQIMEQTSWILNSWMCDCRSGCPTGWCPKSNSRYAIFFLAFLMQNFQTISRENYSKKWMWVLIVVSNLNQLANCANLFSFVILVDMLFQADEQTEMVRLMEEIISIIPRPNSGQANKESVMQSAWHWRVSNRPVRMCFLRHVMSINSDQMVASCFEQIFGELSVWMFELSGRGYAVQCDSHEEQSSICNTRVPLHLYLIIVCWTRFRVCVYHANLGLVT